MDFIRLRIKSVAGATETVTSPQCHQEERGNSLGAWGIPWGPGEFLGDRGNSLGA